MQPERSVEIVEVGPRDGYQGIGPFIPTQTKIDFLERLFNAGLHRIEIGSFVSSSAVPQLRDTREVLEWCARLPGLKPQVLVANERRGRDAVEAGAQRLVFVLSVSEAHNRNNVRRHPIESAQEYERLLAAIPASVGMRLDIATAFDCPFTGRVPASETLDLLERLVSRRPASAPDPGFPAPAARSRRGARGRRADHPLPEPCPDAEIAGLPRTRTPYRPECKEHRLRSRCCPALQRRNACSRPR